MSYMTMHSKKRACDRCYRLKRSCSGNPCSNCKKSNTVCSFHRQPLKTGRKRTNSASVKPSIKYSHTGCDTCRRRKKKCDETWPNCQNCQNLNLECLSDRLGESMSDKLESMRDGGSPVELGSGLGGGPMTGYMNGTGNGSMNGPINIATVSEMTNDFLLNGLQDELTHKERFLLNSLIRSPTFPIDLNDGVQGREPVHQEGETGLTGGGTGESGAGGTGLTAVTGVNGLNGVNLTESINTNTSPNSNDPETYKEEINHLLTMCSLNSLKIPSKDLELLRYFITNVSPLLFVDKTSTRFLRTVIPLAVDDPMVRVPILGIAASHRANQESVQIQESVHLQGHNSVHQSGQTPGQNSYKRDSLIYIAKSQSLFVNTKIDYFEDSENVLLSIILTAIQDIFEGTSLAWNFLLEKAASVIEKRGGINRVSKFAPLSVQLFCYLDLMSSLSTCASPYVDKTSFADYDEDHIENILNNKFGFRFGIAGEIFKIVGNISTLASLRDTRFKTRENESRFNTLANLIEMRLQYWSPKLDFVANTFRIDNSIDEGKLILSSFTVALQWSAFLRLHQIRFGYDRKDSRVEACLAIILRSMKVIQYNTDLETGLMFPLIMAGSVAYKPDDRAYILSRIRSIKDRLKFSYLGEFEKLLLSVWERDNGEGHHVNWAKIRYFEYSGLVMF